MARAWVNLTQELYRSLTPTDQPVYDGGELPEIVTADNVPVTSAMATTSTTPRAQYRPPRSQTFQLLFAAPVVLQTDFTVMATTDKPPPPYSPPRSKAMPIVGDGIPAFTGGMAATAKPPPLYSAPRSVSILPMGQGDPVVLQTAISSRIVLPLKTVSSTRTPVPPDVVPDYQPTLASSRRIVPLLVTRSLVFLPTGGGDSGSVTVTPDPGGGGFGAEMGGKFLNRYTPGYQGQYKPGYRSHMRKVKA